MVPAMTDAPVIALPRATRYIENDSLGIMVAGRVCNFGINGIFVDCIECGRRDRIAPTSGSERDATERISDDHAEAIFRSRGWTVGPTRCPDHARRRGGS